MLYHKEPLYVPHTVFHITLPVITVYIPQQHYWIDLRNGQGLHGLWGRHWIYRRVRKILEKWLLSLTYLTVRPSDRMEHIASSRRSFMSFVYSIIILKPCNLYLLYAFVPTKLHLKRTSHTSTVQQHPAYGEHAATSTQSTTSITGKKIQTCDLNSI